MEGQPPFLYGTHYSAPGYVLYYLVREGMSASFPFTFTENLTSSQHRSICCDFKVVDLMRQSECFIVSQRHGVGCWKTLRM